MDVEEDAAEVDAYTPLVTRGFELVPWQLAAVDAWVKGFQQPFSGSLEVFTGGGKTLLAITAMAEAAQEEPLLKVAVVVPTEALARQWIANISKFTNIAADQIGMMGAGGKADLHQVRILVCVLNSAAKKLPDMAADIAPLMLIVDECHRAGAPSFARVLDTPAQFRMGLSATPDREELDENGEPLVFDEQRVGKALGGVVYRFSLKDAREIGWLPDYKISHHGITLTEDERNKYKELSRYVDDLAEKLRQFGVDSSRAFSMQRQQGETGDLARAYVGATAKRKDFLYRAKDRSRVAAKIVSDAMQSRTRRVLLFHERVAEATDLYQQLGVLLPEVKVVLEHSQLPDSVRKSALAEFRTGEAPVLVSVKSLIEGIDVPEADVGVSVASSSSVRQRIQALGRVLRRTFDDESMEPKVAEMHVLYVAKTVDELIYAKEDWGDLTGDAENSYWLWSNDPDAAPAQQEGPPASPRPTEDQEWERLGQRSPAEPVLWEGAFVGQEYSVDTLGNLRNMHGTLIANPQGVSQMVQAVRKSPGGKFRVTPLHRLVLIASDGKERNGIWVAGQLSVPFAAVEEPLQAEAEAVDVETLKPGERYLGPANADGGTFKIRQKQGGVIEQKVGRSVMFALTESEAHPDLAANAVRLLAAWKSALDFGLTVKLNGLGHVWYEAEGERRFLVSAPGGFVWPEDP
ncbi:DNA/RNA helicase, superfamily II [Actinobacteria bacterium IMCC26207]|nr:DNA/RNA helicase, superfamily II [Actinobacteria bacterium IMCC26207]